MSEELPSPYTVGTLEEWRRLSEDLLSKGTCHIPCSCVLKDEPKCTGTSVITSQCIV